MKKSTKTTLVVSSLLYLLIHAGIKIMTSYYDWQHWLVAVAAILIAIGYFKER